MISADALRAMIFMRLLREEESGVQLRGVVWERSGPDWTDEFVRMS